MKRKITSVVLALSMLLTCFAASMATANAADNTSSPVGASTNSLSHIQGGAVLHCFNWSYNQIKANLSDIKAAGYTAVQTSPVQPPKDYNKSWTDRDGQWWKLYQPIDIKIADGNTWLGTKAELKSLCDTAESMGIKVVVDIVANHLGNVTDDLGNQMSNISSQVNSTYRNDSSCWHINNMWANDDNNRYSMTMGTIGLPDLNTGNSKVQNAYKQLVIDCINLGVDGFRFDAAKHIELPNDSGNSSQFWPVVINGSQSSTSNNIYYYGEVLNYCGTDISNYTKYMSVTDNYTSDCKLVAANNGNASALASPAYVKGAAPNKSVLWVESHDTYMGNEGSSDIKNTSSVSDSTIIKAWGIVGSRADSTSLFFARPATTMGSASTNTTWKSKAVAEVNKFKNYFDGQSEYLASSGSIAYNERGTSGVVLVNCSGTSASVSVKANKMANGTYKDAITGNTFTVSNGTISGKIGNTGVAVVYNAGGQSTTQATQQTTKATQSTTQPVTKPSTKVLIGDVNLGGVITISDASDVQLYITDQLTFTDDQKIAADTNGDGLIDIKDATVIQCYIAGISLDNSLCGKYVGQEEPQKNYLYYKNTSNWSNLRAYYWSTGNTTMTSWPGELMESVGNNVYRIEVPANAESIIFNNGSDSGKTGDIKIEGMNKIYENGKWYDYNSEILPTDPIETDDYVYYYNSNNWSTVKAYYWAKENIGLSEWPGELMESVGNNVYRIKIPAEAESIIFNNGSDSGKTGDIDLEGTGKIYKDGKWSTYTG